MKLGILEFDAYNGQKNLVAKPVQATLSNDSNIASFVTEIDPNLADTASFCAQYRIAMDISANCVILEAKRADKVWYIACMILATDRADVNGVIRKYLDARKISFAPMELTLSLSGMEYGGITPIGLPNDWIILVDENVVKTEYVIIGSGLRKSKLAVAGKSLAELPNATALRLARR